MSLNLGNLDIEGRWAGMYTYAQGNPQLLKTDGESDFTIYPVLETKANGEVLKISGEGRDAVGPFSFDGQIHPNARVNFIKRYSTHWWRYEGVITPETNMMYGTWGLGQAGGGGLFAFHLVGYANTDAQERLRAMTGNWSGTHNTPTKTITDNFYLSGQRGKMAEQLIIHGHSTKQASKYTIKGVVSPSGRVIFAKIFDRHIYLYRGAFQNDDNNTLSGQWQGNGMEGEYYFNRT